MGTRHSRAKFEAAEKTQQRGNLGVVAASPKQRSNKSNNSDPSSRSSTSQHWIHQGVDVQDVYDMHEVIAYGHLGPVRICSRRRQQHSTHTGECVLVEKNHVVSISERTNNSSESSNTTSNKGSYHRLFACKTICSSRLRQDVQEELLEDITRIRDLPHHSNIVSFHQVYRMKRQIQIITELCSGGDLHSRMHVLTEIDIVDILEQVTSAIAFLHEYGISHSNLKLENVLYEHVGSNAGIKLVDFGISRRYGQCRKCRQVCGAEYVSAPEVYFDTSTTDSPNISPASDVWSIGVLAYYMLSGGTYPFGTDRVVDEDLLKTASVSFDDEEWNQRGISETARTFCKQCFALDPNQRWTASKALEFIQEWMTTVETLTNEQPTELPRPTMDVSLRGTQGFDLFGQRRKRLLTSLATTMNSNDLKKLQDLLLDLDSSESGVLTMNQVKHAVKQYSKQEEESCTLTKDDIKLMFKGCHQDRSGSIEYVPFLNAVVAMQGMMTHERLGDELDRADPEDKGLVSKEELKRILCHHGCDEHVVDMVIIESKCETHGGMVEYDVFLETMFRDPGEAMKHVHQLPNDSM